MNKIYLYMLSFFLISSLNLRISAKIVVKVAVKELPFVIIICSFNNALWVIKNLDSIFMQRYKNFRVVYVDDASQDNTAELVKLYIEKYALQDKVTLITNNVRRRKMNNIYNVFYSCDDNEIIIQLDGDDWFKHNKVLSTLNNIYARGYWLVYGQFEFSTGQKGFCKKISRFLIKKGLLRKKVGVSSFIHPRTFYSWLFKLIKLEDLIIESVPGWEGQFFPCANDQAIMYPMIEMASEKSGFNSKVLYVYNQNNPISGNFIEKNLGRKCQNEVRFKKNSYKKVVAPVLNRLDNFRYKNADLVIVAKQFDNLISLIESIKLNVNGINKTYIVYEGDALDQNLLKDIEHTFSEVHFLKFEKTNNFKQVFINFLSKLQDHIIFMSDNYFIKDKINISIGIVELERTFAYGFYFGLSLDEFERKNVPCQLIKKDLYTWKYLCDKENNFDPYTFSMVLYRKKDVLFGLQKNNFNLASSIRGVLKSLFVNQNKVGLFLETSKVGTFDLKDNFINQKGA